MTERPAVEGPLSPNEFAVTQSRYWPTRIGQDEREHIVRDLRRLVCYWCGGRGMHVCPQELGLEARVLVGVDRLVLD